MASSGFQYGELDEDSNQASALKSGAILVGRHRSVALGLGTCLFVTGFLSLVIGGIGYLIPGFTTNFSIVIGVNIWTGLIVSLNTL